MGNIPPYTMAHSIRDKKKILTRIKRIQGQLDALSAAVGSEKECYQVMQLLDSCRGALNGLMGDMVNSHIQDHVVMATNKQAAAKAGDELIEIMRSFWK